MKRSKIHDIEPGYISKAVGAARGNVTEAAAMLGVSRGALWRYFKKQGGPPKAEPESPDVRDLRRAEKVARDATEALKREKQRREQAEQELEGALEREKLWTDISNANLKPKALRIPKPNGKSSSTAIICANDWHAGETIPSDLVNGLNRFDPEICRARVDRLWSKSIRLIEFSRGLCDIQSVVLWLGGDLINNYLQDEAMESNSMGPMEEVVFVRELVADGIATLLKSFSSLSVRVVCNYGNHGRITAKRRISTGWKTNLEYLLYLSLAKQFPNIQWDVARGYHNYIDIGQTVVRFHHGCAIRYQGGIGGVAIPVEKAVRGWNLGRKADLDVFGHYHVSYPTWRWTCSGCLCGYSPFALSIKADVQPPTQQFIVIDHERGKTLDIPMFVQES